MGSSIIVEVFVSFRSLSLFPLALFTHFHSNSPSHSEDEIALAILRLLEIEKSVVEGAGATGLAACLSGKLEHLKGKK